MPSMTPTEVHVWSMLQSFHQGRQCGVRTEEFARELGLSRRHLREIVAALVRVHELPIGSTTEHGTYIVVDAEDQRLADQCLMDEAFPTIDRRRALARAWERVRPRAEGRAIQGSLFAPEARA
ncbi:MAG: hypothetical protein NTU93_00115 [Arthrobacter sp.]|nr:hypothetical protein [Arthrobacter sp.]